MKTSFIFLFFIFSLNINSQNPLLTNQNWYVQNLNINGTNINIPSDPLTFAYVNLNFTTNFSYSSSETSNNNGCGVGFYGNINFVTDNQFIYTNFEPINNSSTCVNDIGNFINEYLSFFNSTIQNNFIYTITDGVNNSKTLTITNNNNDFITLTNKYLTPPPSELTSVDKWYLDKLIINGIEYPIDYSTLSFWLDFDYFNNEPTGLYHNVCYDFLSGIQNFDNSNNKFYYYHQSVGISGCLSDYDNLIHDMNITFYSQQSPGPFYYSVSGNQELQLVITAPNGDQAIYGNNPLSVNDYLDYSFKTYPNPVSDFLYIDNKNNLEIQKISISNTIGQILQTTNQVPIDFSIFEQGIYNLTIETKQGNLNKLIIKK